MHNISRGDHCLSLALGSKRCLPCSNKYFALLVPLTLAGPVLVGFIKLLDLTFSQGTMNGLRLLSKPITIIIFLPWKSTHILSVFIYSMTQPGLGC